MTHRTLAALAAATAAVALFPFSSLGQTLGGRGRGLDALDESVVIGRMNNDGLDNLIDRDLDVFKVPPAEREQLKAGGDLTALANAGGLKPADRRALAERVAKALDATVEKATDPAVLQQQAYQLTAAGVQPTVDELEYFGANAEASAQLNPVVATVRHLFQKEADLAHARADAIVNQMNNGNFAQLNPKRAAASALKRNAEFSYHRTAYALCLSLPADDTAGRKRTADEAIDYLKKYDDPRSGIQAGIRVVLGKLMLVKGDTKGAKAMLESVYSGPPTKPLPTDAEGNDARYFAAVADLAAGDFAAVTTELSDLNRWQGINYLPKLQPGEQDQVKATDAMLQFRLDTAQADAAANPADKQKFNDAAITVLSDLLQSQPDPTLHDLVFDQLAGRIPANPDFATLNPLALQAVQQDGFDQFNKKEGEPIDKAKLERGIAASREIVKREGEPGITHQMAVDALYFIAYAEQTKLHDDPAAAEAFVDFMAKFPNEGAKSTDALDHAGYLVFKLHHAADAAHAPDPAEATLYDRFLPLAVNAPYNQKQIAGDYADLLRTQGKYAEALKYYGMVAPNDKGYASAQFRTLLTLYGALGDGKATDAADKKAMADQLQTVAERVDQQAAAAAASAKDDAAKQQALGQVAIARFDAAISARRDLKDPAKSLQWLADFDQKIAGLSNAKSFGQAVTVQQVNDYMDQGKTPEATAALLKLLNDDPDAGEGLMFDLIHQIDHDLGVARGNHDVDAERKLADNKAQLSGFLVKYAQTNKNPEVRAQLPAYRLYDADSKRQAAELDANTAVKQGNLNAALAQYQTLKAIGGLSPDAVAALDLGIADTQYDLGQYAAAVKSFAPVMTKVGQPFLTTNGVQEANPQYWETYYKQLRSIAEVAKSAPADAQAQKDLTVAKQKVTSFFILYGDKTGGPGYHDDFVDLAKQLNVKVPVARK